MRTMRVFAETVTYKSCTKTLQKTAKRADKTQRLGAVYFSVMTVFCTYCKTSLKFLKDYHTS